LFAQGIIIAQEAVRAQGARPSKRESRMGVQLTDEEIDEFLLKSHTLILSTVRRSGEPFMTPNWYVWLEGAFWIGTLAKAAKVQHIRRDPRVCCLVEEGERWVDLKAVVANCDAMIVDSQRAIERFYEERDRKYAEFRAPTAQVPDVTKTHYETGRVVLKITPRPGEIRSWYNRKIRMKSPQ
jgi:hypothetical protein